MFRLLDPEAPGQLVAGATEAQAAEAADPATARAMYETMLTVQALDDVFYMAQRQGRVSFYLQAAGEEGATVGAAAGLASEDEMFLQYVSRAETSRGDAVAATWRFRGDESRLRRVEIPRRRVAGCDTWRFRGDESRRENRRGGRPSCVAELGGAQVPRAGRVPLARPHAGRHGGPVRRQRGEPG